MATNQQFEAKVTVQSDGGDARQIDELTQNLLREVARLDDVSARPISGPASKGAKGAFAEVGKFIVEIGPAVVAPFFALVQTFLSQPGRTGTSLVIEAKGKKMELRLDPKLSASEQKQILRQAQRTLEAATGSS